MRARVTSAVVATLAAFTSGCTSSHQSVTKRVVTTTTTTRAGTNATACDAVATTNVVRHLQSTTGSVWVWIESAARPAFRVGSLVKVVWRVTGRGVPRVVLSDPGGRATRLTFGPESHAQSTFRHPGAEYGTGFTPTAPGCWRLTMRRGDVTGSLSLEIAQ